MPSSEQSKPSMTSSHSSNSSTHSDFVFPLDDVTNLIKERSILLHYRSENPIGVGHLRAILSIPWPNAEVHLMEINSNIFMAIFPNFVDKSRVLHRQPWIINGVLLSLACWSPNNPFFTVPVTSCETWVQIHGLNSQHSNNLTVWSIASLFLSYQGHVEVPQHGVQRFGRVRMRVRIDTSKPLIPGCILSYNNGQPYLLSFKFEHFSSICYDCGFVGHTNCGFVQGGDKAMRYGEWLHGDSPVANYSELDPCPHSSTWADMMKMQSNIYKIKNSPTNKENSRWFSPSQHLDLSNIGRVNLQKKYTSHVYNDPILGWTMDAVSPIIEDNFLQHLFCYTSDEHESQLILNWEHSANSSMPCNRRLNQLRNYFVRLYRSIETGRSSCLHQSKEIPICFPNINVIDHVSETEPSSSSSSCSSSSFKSALIM